ncbi:hypothetical protein [Flavobacterium cyclinae]|uniref:hypothetical protein n=1 Tax=Flavobacterium cyclinae TaxID=2895947 RepID=UPI001E5B764C|nr:hypothetical protein [Flavobacterium cyclinae]UGS22313.1 hypothetical protein LOS86_06735 [Flavobacterium cyclinae]
MKLDVNTGSIITQEEAKVLITAFKTKFPQEVTSSFIGANNVKNILDQENCIGLKIHNGYDVENERISLILLGLDADGKEILENGIIYDRILTSPPFGFIESL